MRTAQDSDGSKVSVVSDCRTSSLKSTRISTSCDGATSSATESTWNQTSLPLTSLNMTTNTRPQFFFSCRDVRLHLHEQLRSLDHNRVCLSYSVASPLVGSRIKATDLTKANVNKKTRRTVALPQSEERREKEASDKRTEMASEIRLHQSWLFQLPNND